MILRERYWFRCNGSAREKAKSFVNRAPPAGPALPAKIGCLSHPPAIVCIYNAAPVIKITCCIGLCSASLRYASTQPRKPSSQNQGYLAGRRVLCLFIAVVPVLIAAQKRGYSGRARNRSGRQHQISLPSSQSPYSGSVAQGTVKPEAVSLTFQDAIDLGLKNNLGVLLQSYNTIAARGQKWKELSALLPNVTGAVGVNAVHDNLAARGLRFPGFPTMWGLTVLPMLACT